MLPGSARGGRASLSPGAARPFPGAVALGTRRPQGALSRQPQSPPRAATPGERCATRVGWVGGLSKVRGSLGAGKGGTLQGARGLYFGWGSGEGGAERGCKRLLEIKAAGPWQPIWLGEGYRCLPPTSPRIPLCLPWKILFGATNWLSLRKNAVCCPAR